MLLKMGALLLKTKTDVAVNRKLKAGRFSGRCILMPQLPRHVSVGVFLLLSKKLATPSSLSEI